MMGEPARIRLIEIGEIYVEGRESRMKRKTKQEVNYWQISPGEAGEEAERLWPEFKKKGIIGIGWDYLGDLRKLDRDDLREEGLGRNNANSCWYFAHEMKPGDRIVVKKGTNPRDSNSKYIYGVGRIVGKYKYDREREEYKNIRKVEWIVAFDEPKNFPELSTGFGRTTVCHLSKERFDEIMSLINRSSKPSWKKIAHMLKSKQQIIFYGPPGTEKTYNARKFTVEFIETGSV